MAAERLKALAVAERQLARDRQVEVFAAVFAALLATEVRAANEALGDAFVAVLFDLWIDAFYPEHEQRMRRALIEPVRGYGEEIAGYALDEIGSDAVAPVGAFSSEYTAGAASRWTRSSIAQLRALAKEATPGPLIAERLVDWSDGRALHAGAEEATRAAGAFTMLGYMAGGRTKMRWRARGSSCPLCQRLNGRIVTIGEPFVDEGGKVEAEGEDGEALKFETRTKIGHPPLHGAGKAGVCDCILEAA
ncbi:MAG: hypothetical protein R3344_03750 [Acidobacteriota bacterium]|nr:hypothetical protein [Acidobacteriota bacterium]